MIKNNKRILTVHQGFTLVELMIVVAILGIITSIAYPSYLKQVQKSKRAPAKVELMRIAQLQESYYVQNLSYAVALKTSDGEGDLNFAEMSPQTEGGDYTVSIANTTPSGCDGTSTIPCTGYVIEALPIVGKPQSHDKSCTGFRLSSTNAKFAKSATIDYGDSDVRDTCWR